MRPDYGTYLMQPNYYLNGDPPPPPPEPPPPPPPETDWKEKPEHDGKDKPREHPPAA
jgi:hypothetical protein